MTGRDIFKICMSFADELEPNGNLNPSNAQEYESRTPSILTSLLAELNGYASPVQMVATLDDVLQIDDQRAVTIVPYRLGSELFKEENELIYNHFMKRCRDFKYKRQPARAKPITDVYNLGGA